MAIRINDGSAYSKLTEGSFTVFTTSRDLAEILASFSQGAYITDVLNTTIHKYFLENQDKALEIKKNAQFFYTTGKAVKSGNHFNVPFTLFHD